jgi:hypothetical protein
LWGGPTNGSSTCGRPDERVINLWGGPTNGSSTGAATFVWTVGLVINLFSLQYVRDKKSV